MTSLESCRGKGVITGTLEKIHEEEMKIEKEKEEELKRAIEHHERKYHGRDRRINMHSQEFTERYG
jgi:hypothetical protein